MRRDIGQDPSQRADFQRIVRRNSDVMLRRCASGKPNVAAGLPRYSIPNTRQRLDEVSAGQVPRQFHAAMTSSRTK